MGKPLIIAHRGDSAHVPENTLPSFKKAIDVGADGIELDVHLSKDGHLVVIHDEKLDRTSNAQGLVKDHTLSDLKTFDFGGWFNEEFRGLTIPTLEEVMDLTEGWPGLINIEIKSGPIIYPGIERLLVDVIKKYGREDRVIISSFNHYSLREIKTIEREIRIGLLYMSGLVEPWHYAQRLAAYSLHPFFPNIIPELVRGCKENGIALYPFTVDEESHIAALLQAGVDGLITNQPERALAVRESLGQQRPIR